MLGHKNFITCVLALSGLREHFYHSHSARSRTGACRATRTTIAKVNSLIDAAVIEELLSAQPGRRTDRPWSCAVAQPAARPSWSLQGIRVCFDCRSISEHARIFYFQNGVTTLFTGVGGCRAISIVVSKLLFPHRTVYGR
jgi:polyphosphate kinase